MDLVFPQGKQAAKRGFELESVADREGESTWSAGYYIDAGTFFYRFGKDGKNMTERC
jgi:hypothetical protein